MIIALKGFMTIRQREPLIKHRGDTERLRKVSISFDDFMRENSTCQYKHADEMLIAMLPKIDLPFTAVSR